MTDLTPLQDALELGCSRTLFHRLIERGDLPGTYELPGSKRKRILRAGACKSVIAPGGFEPPTSRL
jgi:hypothetical protein